MPKLELDRDQLRLLLRALMNHPRVTIDESTPIIRRIDRALAEPELPTAQSVGLVRNACTEGTCLHETCSRQRVLDDIRSTRDLNTIMAEQPQGEPPTEAEILNDDLTFTREEFSAIEALVKSAPKASAALRAALARKR